MEVAKADVKGISPLEEFSKGKPNKCEFLNRLMTFSSALQYLFCSLSLKFNKVREEAHQGVAPLCILFIFAHTFINTVNKYIN